MIAVYELGITAIILPEFDRLMNDNDSTLAHHTLQAIQLLNQWIKNPDLLLSLSNVSAKEHPFDKEKIHRILVLSLFFHDSGKKEDGSESDAKIAKAVLRRLKFDNETIDKVTTLVAYHDNEIPPKPSALRHLANCIGPDLMPYLFLIRRAILESEATEGALAALDQTITMYKEILQNGDCLTSKSLAITGKDLLAIGFHSGKVLGETLQFLLNEVLELPENNTYEILLTKAKEVLAAISLTTKEK